MGLDFLMFGAVRRAMHAVRERRGRGPASRLRVATLGYLDIIMTDHELEDAVGGAAGRLEARPDLEAIQRAHHAGRIGRAPTMHSFFGALGCDVASFDFARHEGSEIVWDLSLPIPDEHHGKFDLVIDGGTCEHVFDVATALRNCVRMTALGGCVVHANPLAMGNHAFYAFNPTFMHDFYSDNGFRVLSIEAFSIVVDGASRGYRPLPVPQTARFSLAQAGEAILLTVVQRERVVEPLVNPIQTSYRPTAPVA